MNFVSLMCIIGLAGFTIATEDNYVCEHETFHIKCAVGQMISVSSAVYGRQKSNVCTNGPNPQTNNCAAVNSLKLVQDQCEGRETCDIQASNGVFQDPCVGTFKYLEIVYSCKDYVCEHDTLHLECAVGQTISVSSALYGRQKSNVCTNGPNPQTNNCAAVNSLKLVQDQCEGHETCDIQASNGVFGDPCVGTFKYLEIEYSCEDAEIDDDSYVCEHETFQLKCAVGQTISVSSALYGRQTPNVCSTNGPIETNNCAAVDSLTRVQEQCEGKKHVTSRQAMVYLVIHV
ncbi:L-rhamnose-binding lectin SML-like isoform X2 [Amphiura filiformis]|uniref:L-rhamnose-binding lectin SML-like isoform X2 n=1 Tax=Amphiura filiformis TaxID=82378 RepID=UPI003B21D5DA